MAENTMPQGSKPTAAELEKINKMSRRRLAEEEVFVFSVVLCDNEVDRDNERFSIDALHTLAGMYVGKTGIFDHSMHGRDQCARIFECEVVADGTQKTSAGEAYHCLKAKAYMPRTESNRDLMLEIDAGIKKEVSVGCATAGRTCSICGADLRNSTCGHRPGRSYTKNGSKVKCHAILSDPTDAYEWSFVAVPAQQRAGVTKAFKLGTELDIDAVIKSLSLNEDITVSAVDSQQLVKLLTDLRDKAEDGAVYRDELCKEAARLCLAANPAMTAEAVGTITANMSVAQLKAFNADCKKAAAAVLPICPQLAHEKPKQKPSADTNYII